MKLDRKASFWGGCNFRFPPEQSLLIESTSHIAMRLVLEANSQRREVSPFDFRSFGFGLLGDFDRKTTYYKTLFNHMENGKDAVTVVDPRELQNPLLQKKAIKTFNVGGIVLSIDTGRGYWPVRAVLDQPAVKRSADGRLVVDGEKRIGVSKCEIDLIEVDDKWVPRWVTYSDARDEVKIHFTWKSVNAKPDKMDFSDQRLLRLIEKNNDQ
ncbi:MAG: hypothetical protein ACF8AM_13130 [Rhodopirellula sp. JB055]|uniref:hypothetical protein n=1 Tax=Rhodopirellula sp. JB055 TaxID=3342846 RepID=UPI00370CED48